MTYRIVLLTVFWRNKAVVEGACRPRMEPQLRCRAGRIVGVHVALQEGLPQHPPFRNRTLEYELVE